MKNENAPRHVYFVQADTPEKPIKIGLATDVGRRLTDLRAGCPVHLTLLGSIQWDDAPELERRLHKVFAPYRLRGEWFRPIPELLAMIAERATPPAAPSEPLTIEDVQHLLPRESKFRQRRRAPQPPGRVLHSEPWDGMGGRKGQMAHYKRVRGIT